MIWYKESASWSFILRSYLPRLLFCNLLWEILQLPLYTLWAEANLPQITFSVVHCTLGDAMIGITALILALIVCHADSPPTWPKTKIVLIMVILAVGYTVLSEKINVAQDHWVYSLWMPILPWVNVGLSPLLQWIIVPLLAWHWAMQQASSL